MDVSPTVLRKETVQHMSSLSHEMKRIEEMADRDRCSPYEVVDHRGNAIYPTLVLARLTGLNTLTALNEQGKKR